ncbi:MAG: penicillin-binding protein [Candidatus Roizmanbacteria bacterium]
MINLMSRRRSAKDRMLLKKLLMIAIGGTIALFLLVLVSFAIMARDLPSPGILSSKNDASTVFYDRDGKVLFEMYKDKNRVPVSVNDIPLTLKQATIAVEDKSFYKHQGFSLFGIIRALESSIFKGRLEGGSTLTQQLVKNVLLSRERTLTRKMKEFVLSVEIERRYSKDQILEMYLNEAPYGGSFWGVQSAARGYFGKDVKELSLIQAAIIAGLPQSPSRYSPYIGIKDAYKPRTKGVLRRMKEEGYITPQQEKKALSDLEKVSFGAEKLSISAPHFVFYVRSQLVKEFGEAALNQGLKVYTTLSLDLQNEAEKIVHDEVEKIKPLKATNGSLVMLENKTGDILSYVGSYDYNDDKYGRFDTASQALRQPGSSIKPFTYAAAFMKGYTPGTLLMDVKTEFPDQGNKSYSPVNYDGKYRGPVQLRFALGNSYNIPAVKLLALVGIKPVLQTAYDMGISTLAPDVENMKRFGLSLTLGGGEVRLLELTNAYAGFARQGAYIPTRAILEVKDHNNRSIFKAKEERPKQAVSKEVAFLISHILSDNVARTDAFGPGSFLNIKGKTVAVKTGTTNSKRDNWTLGFTNDITIGTWVGNNDNTPMNEKIASGVTGASPIWARMMREGLKKFEDGIMPVPDGVQALQIDSYLGGLPKDGQPTRSEYFVKGTEPTDKSPFYKKVKLSRSDNNRLANDIEVGKGEYDEKEYIVITEKDPVSTDGKNRWQEAIAAWIESYGDARFKVPKETSSGNQDEVVSQIKSPSDHSSVTGNSIEFRAKINSVEDIVTVEVFVDDQLKKTWTGNQEEVTETLTVPDGTHKIGIKATNKKGRAGETSVTIAVNKPWEDATPTPAP